MADNRRERQELFLLKERLEKYTGKDDDSSAQDSIMDILNILKNFQMTFELLVDTRIGQNLGDVVKKYGEAEVAQLAKRILKTWKKDLKPASESASSKSSSTPAREESSAPPSISTAASDTDLKSKLSTPRGSSDGDGSWGFEEEYAKLEPRRLTMVQQFINRLMLTPDADEYLVKFIAFTIDKELNSLCPEANAYTAKARSLVSNLKTNEALREEVLIGAITPAALVRKNPRDLASDTVKEELRKRKELLEQGRSTDQYNELRAVVQQQIGINTEGGEFTCSRCKGTKTSHYSMQTRSSDEPMTVFVTCLTCRKRWRE